MRKLLLSLFVTAVAAFSTVAFGGARSPAFAQLPGTGCGGGSPRVCYVETTRECTERTTDITFGSTGVSINKRCLSEITQTRTYYWPEAPQTPGGAGGGGGSMGGKKSACLEGSHAAHCQTRTR